MDIKKEIADRKRDLDILRRIERLVVKLSKPKAAKVTMASSEDAKFKKRPRIMKAVWKRANETVHNYSPLGSCVAHCIYYVVSHRSLFYA